MVNVKFCQYIDTMILFSILMLLLNFTCNLSPENVDLFLYSQLCKVTARENELIVVVKLHKSGLKTKNIRVCTILSIYFVNVTIIISLDLSRLREQMK